MGLSKEPKIKKNLSSLHPLPKSNTPIPQKKNKTKKQSVGGEQQQRDFNFFMLHYKNSIKKLRNTNHRIWSLYFQGLGGGGEN